MKYKIKDGNNVLQNIHKTDSNIITYSWSTDKDISHKISGHLFEAIDYFLQLGIYAQNKTLILIPEIDGLRMAQINLVIRDKYKEELHDLIYSKLIFGRPKVLITTGDITVCDGVPPACEMFCDQLNLWLCSKEYWWATTNRLGRNAFKVLNINYLKSVHRNINELKELISNLYPHNKTIFFNNRFIKMIYPNNYKVPNWNEKEFRNSDKIRVLIYATGNCRSLGILQEAGIDIEEDLTEAFKKIKELFPDKKIQIIYAGTNDKDLNIMRFLNRIEDINLMVITEDALPILNLHDNFDMYLYTPTGKNWDCSPRLLKECYVYKKPVMFCKSVVLNIKENTGLKVVYDLAKEFYGK